VSRIRVVAAVLFALPLIVFGANDFIHVFTLPPGDGSDGAQLLQAMRDGGLMTAIAASHVLVGALLLIPRTRFAAALAQISITLGIVAFHATMLPAGLGFALAMLTLNVLVLTDPCRLRSLVARDASAE